MIDLVYLTEIYIENEETLRKRLSKQSCSVALSNIERLRLSIASLEENINFDSLRRLQRSFSRLLGVPVKPTLVRLCGASKGIARKLGKEVEFSVYGDDITLDKKMLSDLRDSITHILRNSIDHGIESPEERRQKGKNRKGVVAIQCRQSEDSVIINIRDDGKGIDADIVAKKALQLGRISMEALNSMTQEEKIALIFLPSFSTKDEFTDISGRGIGLDSVKQNVERVGGTFQIETQVGQGTRFSIRVKM